MHPLDLCDERRDLKKKRFEAGANKQEDSEGSEESKGGLDGY